MEVVAYDRGAGWTARRLVDLAAGLDLAALGVALPLADIYRYTALSAAGDRA